MKRELETPELTFRVVDDAYRSRLYGRDIPGIEKRYSELERSGRKLDVVARKFMERNGNFFEGGIVISIGIDIEPREALKILSAHCKNGIINLENYIIFASYKNDKNDA